MFVTMRYIHVVLATHKYVVATAWLCLTVTTISFHLEDAYFEVVECNVLVVSLVNTIGWLQRL